MKIIQYILCLTAMYALLVSCQRDLAVSAGEEGIPVEIYFRVNVSDRTAVSRSLAGLGVDENTIHDLNIFVFDQSTGDLDGKSFIENVETSPARMYVAGTTGLRTFVVIANAGSEITGVGSLDDLTAITRTLPSGTAFLNGGYNVMAGEKTNVSVDLGGSPTPNVFDLGTLDVERLTAKVTVVIDKSGLDLGSYDLFTIDVQQIQLRQVPSSYLYLGDNTPDSGLVDGDVTTLIDGNLSPESHDEATPLYMLENKQGTKTPSTGGVNYINGEGTNLGPRYTSPMTMVPEGGDIGLCSYVEITASYHRYDLTPQGAEGADGEVIYKIFLGTGLSDGAWNNFDVNRNTWYKVTVFLKGKGGADEISWRIDTEITDYSPDDPDDSDRYAYTIDPEDSLYWTVSNNDETQYQWSSNNGNVGQILGEYYEGRRATYILSSFNNESNFPAFQRCLSMNDAGDSFANLKYYLPAQNELQMLNIHRNASFTPGLYWSSTQLNEGASNNNQYARLIDYNNNGEAFTQHKNIYAYVRCLRVPPHLEVNPAWDGKVYPYVDVASPYPLVVNRESRPDGSPRGLKAFALRTGAPFEFLTSNYHTVQLVYMAYRVARADCNPDGTPVAAGSTAPMDWYTAVGYLPATPSDVGYVPQVNPVRTGCNAYYEDGDISQIGKWRLPTSLELQQMWIMGAGTKGTRPADPSLGGTLYGYDASGNILGRLAGINDSFSGTGYIPLYGTIATLSANIGAIGSSNPSYSLNNCYWSCTTTGNSDGSAFVQNRYAYKMDFYSGDGYAGRWDFHPVPDKTNPGLVRCVMDVVR